MRFSSPICIAVLVATMALSVSAQRDKCEDVLQARIDCFDTEGPCDSLPIPDVSFGTEVDPAKGYTIETLREGMYAVTEGSYWFMVMVAENTGDSGTEKSGKKANEKSGKKASEKSGKKANEKSGKKASEKSGKKASKKNGKKKARRARGARALASRKMGKAGTYNVAILDFPEGNFVQRDNTGAVSGSLVTAAIEEIVSEIEGIPAGFIYDVQMVYSHQHFDHIGAATITYDYIMNNWKPTGEVQIIADESVHEEFTERAEAEFFSFRAPFPDHLITEDTTEIPLTNDVGYSVTQTGGHTSGKDLIIFVERKGDSPPIMMVVDVVFPGWAPFFDFAIATDVFQYLKVHETLLNDFDLGDDGIFIGGHLAKLGKRSDIEINLAWTNSVLDNAAAALGSVDIGPIAGASGVFDPTHNNYGNSWILFSDYFDELVRVCAKAVVAEFGCVLGSVDVTTQSSCNSAQTFWRVDY